MNDLQPFGHGWSVLRPYAWCLVSVGAALALAQLLQSSVPGFFVFPFLAAVLVSAQWSLKGPAVFATLLSALAMTYFFLPPVHSLAIERASLPLLFLFVGCALMMTSLMSE